MALNKLTATASDYSREVALHIDDAAQSLVEVLTGLNVSRAHFDDFQLRSPQALNPASPPVPPVHATQRDDVNDADGFESAIDYIGSNFKFHQYADPDAHAIRRKFQG